MNNSLIETMEDISIRGRVAYALCCLKIYLRNFDEFDCELLFSKLETYTQIQYLDEWHMEVAEYIPSTIMAYEKFDEKEFDYVTLSQFEILAASYKRISKESREIIDSIFLIGTIELYGSVQKRGKSFEYLVNLIGIMVKRHLDLPNVDIFKKYKFENQQGWGDTFPFEDVAY